MGFLFRIQSQCIIIQCEGFFVYSGSVSRWLMHMSYLILAVSDGIFTLSFLILNSRIVH